MKKIFILLSTLALMSMNAQNTVVSNFDNISTAGFSSWGKVAVQVAANPDVSGTNAALVSLSGSNSDGDGLVMDLASTMDSTPYTAVLVDVKSTANNFSMLLAFENSTTGAQSADWSTYPKYTGNGQWQTVSLPTNFADIQFNKIVIRPAAWENFPAFDFYMDNVTLTTSTLQVSELNKVKPEIIFADGTLLIKNVKNGATAEIYSMNAQSVLKYDAYKNQNLNINSKGITPGVYVVKVTSGEFVQIKKIIVK